MLHSEFHAEWENQIAAIRFGPPIQLDPIAAEYVMAYYLREELDAICSGPDRHARFVKWAIQNWPMLSRDIEREKERCHDALRAKAQTRAVKL